MNGVLLLEINEFWKKKKTNLVQKKVGISFDFSPYSFFFDSFK